MSLGQANGTSLFQAAMMGVRNANDRHINELEAFVRQYLSIYVNTDHKPTVLEEAGVMNEANRLVKQINAHS